MFQFFGVKFSIYLNRRVFVMRRATKAQSNPHIRAVSSEPPFFSFIQKKKKEIVSEYRGKDRPNMMAAPVHYENMPIQIY